MMMIAVISLFLGLAYAALMLLYRYGWKKQAMYPLPDAFRPVTSISIIIPARNEAANITACLQSILSHDYPAALLEVVVVDDHSEDETAALVRAFNKKNLRCISLADVLQGNEPVIAYKKKALSTGIAHSSGTLIVTTDADCIAPPQWLKHIAAIYEAQEPAMIIAPVDFTCNGSVVELFQSIDFMTMQGITAAAHYLRAGGMSNGANLAFTRTAFLQAGGYDGIDHLASGDDYLLLMKMQQLFPDKIAYLKAQQAIMATAPQPDWGSFLQQRIRWASKSGKYDDHRMTAILLLVYLFNLSLALLFVAAFCYPLLWKVFSAVFLLKLAAELYFLLPVAAFFRKRWQLYWFPLLQPLHIAYIVLAGFLGFLGAYRWKGRRVK